MFEEWFKHYPKKIAVGSARSAYSNAIFFKGATEEQLLDAVKAYAQLTAGQDKQFIPKPSNWLQEERWHDEDIQHLIERVKEKKELAGWKKLFSDTLGYEVFKAWCSDANFEDGILMTKSSFKAEWLKNHHAQALERMGVKQVMVAQ